VVSYSEERKFQTNSIALYQAIQRIISEYLNVERSSISCWSLVSVYRSRDLPYSSGFTWDAKSDSK
jgi:hypothetical protein